MKILRSLCFRLLLPAACVLSGCSAAEWVGMKLMFSPAPVEESQVLRDIPYVKEEAHLEKHRFDLFLPQGEDWPTLIFVHGGGWTAGDKALKSGGYAVYGNIGAYYAGQGIAVAVLNYRLQPEVTWREQVLDVARAVVRVRREVAQHGGDPRALFLVGHSAGAQLATFTAVADWPLQVAGEAVGICGVVAVSGAGYDLADDATYTLGANPKFYEKIFRDQEEEENWAGEASALNHLDAGDPPFLIFYAGREYRALQRQARLLEEGLGEVGVKSRLVVVERQGHRRIVVTLSQGEHPMTAEVLRFVEEQTEHCREADGG